MASGAKVLILCVNRLLRESIARILAKRTDFEIAAQAEPCTSVEYIRDSGADVLVLDSLDFLLDSFASSSAAGKHERLVKRRLIAMADDRGSFLEAMRRGGGGSLFQHPRART